MDCDFLFCRWINQLRYDWIQNLIQQLGCTSDHGSAVKALCDFQYSCGIPISGFIDAETRLRLIAEYPSLRIKTVGPYLEERQILSPSSPELAQWDRLSDILRKMGSVVLEEEESAQILAIRGVEYSSCWRQTSSARQFVESSYGERTHFSSLKPDYADSMIAVMWKEGGEKHVRCFSGCVSPNAVWPTGTAHLCQGQYLYKIGRHRTRDAAHIEGVNIYRPQWPDDWIYDQTADSIQYAALEGVSSIEVVRSSGSSLDISEDDIMKAEMAIARRQPTFVDTLYIKINVHTCACNQASSLGCQNILPGDYAEFMGILMRVRDRQVQKYGYSLDIPYTLVDASYIE